MIKKCKICGREFETIYKRQEVCKDTHFAKCVICGNKFELKHPYTAKTCSKQCAAAYSKQIGSMNAGREKAKQTMKERYGVEHALQNKEIKDRMKTKFKELYGVENPMQVEAVKNKAKVTNLEKYGVDNASKSAIVKQKIKTTFSEKYGVDNAMKVEKFKEKQQVATEQTTGFRFALQSENSQAKMRKTCLKKYKANYYLSSDQARKALHDYCKQTYNVDYITQSDEIKEKIKQTCLQKYGVPFNCMREECRESYRTISKLNLAFKEFLESKDIQVDELEFPLDRRSFDFKINNTLIEIDPSITHNAYMSIFDKDSSGLDRNYHCEKSKLAEENGFRCIHIFDWDKWEKIIQLIQPSEKLFAKNLQLKEVNPAECNLFEINYHLQESCRNQEIRFGLYIGNELVQLMTFGKPRYTKKYNWELLRLCTSPKYHVVGGAEKLFKHFTKLHPNESIISYCDLSKFTGEVYKRLGMKLDHISPPAKNWSKDNKRITDNLLRQRGYDQLFKTNYGKGTSNEQLMLENGWLPVYDCGQAVFIYN